VRSAAPFLRGLRQHHNYDNTDNTDPNAKGENDEFE